MGVMFYYTFFTLVIVTGPNSKKWVSSPGLSGAQCVVLDSTLRKCFDSRNTIFTNFELKKSLIWLLLNKELPLPSRRENEKE